MKHKKLIITLLLVIITIAIITVNSIYFTPHKLSIREETIKSNKISSDFNDYIIAYFSDLHFGTFTNENDLEKLVTTINSITPDVVIFGGDLIDKDANINEEELTQKLSNIKASNNKYAVLGDHDAYDENIKTKIENILTKAGFIILNNTNQKIYSEQSNNFINIVGVDSSYKTAINLESAFENTSDENFTFVISHCPDSFDNINKFNADYVLAGHSHGPQIYVPLFNLLYREEGYEKYVRGKHKNNNSILDITTGVGLTNKSIRLFSDAEVVFYKLVSTN